MNSTGKIKKVLFTPKGDNSCQKILIFKNVYFFKKQKSEKLFLSVQDSYS